MHDRQPSPGKEGRMLIVPENGGEPFYATLLMADEPLEEGTALNKTNLLKDATAALFGLGANAVPDDVLKVIRSVLDIKTEMEIVSYTGTGTAGQSNPTSVTFSKAPSLIIMLGYKDRESGQWYQKRYGDEYDYVYMLPTDLIQVSYTRSKGFGYERNYEIYGKKSVNGRTFSWYSYNKSMGDGTAAEQCNESCYEYYVLGLSTGATSVSGENGGNSGGDDGNGGGGNDSGTTTDTITATIDDYGTITVEAGTTWLEYIAADGASSGFYIDSHDDAVRLDDWYVIDPDGNTAWSDSEIVQGIYYLSEEMGGGV